MTTTQPSYRELIKADNRRRHNEHLIQVATSLASKLARARQWYEKENVQGNPTTQKYVLDIITKLEEEGESDLND